jgi:hypothetical protein
MKIQAGIRLLEEIEGYGNPIQDSDRFDAVLKFYRNRGDPLEFDTILQEPIPYVDNSTGTNPRCIDRMSFLSDTALWQGNQTSFPGFTTQFSG